MSSYFEWLQDLPFSMWIAGSESLLSFPLVLFLHSVGMGLSAGSAYIVCMRLVALGVLLLAFAKRSEELKRGALALFFVIALMSLPTYMTGYSAQKAIKDRPGVSGPLIQR